MKELRSLARVRIKSDFTGSFVGMCGTLVRIDHEQTTLTHLVKLDPIKGEKQPPLWWAPYELEDIGAASASKEGSQNG